MHWTQPKIIQNPEGRYEADTYSYTGKNGNLKNRNRKKKKSKSIQGAGVRLIIEDSVSIYEAPNSISIKP